jgi:hypothetical protein
MLRTTYRSNIYKQSLLKSQISIGAYSSLGDAAKKVGDKISETFEKGKEKLNVTKEEATHKVENQKEKAQQKINEAAKDVEQNTK